jgi:hypothetical protein
MNNVTPTGVTILFEKRHWTNLISFTRLLLDHVASKSIAVSTSMGTDFLPPEEPPINATQAQLKDYERDDRLYNQYREHRLSNSLSKPECRTSTQSQSLSKSISLFNGDAGSLWRFLKEVIQGIRIGYTDAMTHFTNLYQFRIESFDSLVTDYTKFIDNVTAIEARYPNDCIDKALWEAFKTHRFVQVFKDHEEFRDYLNQKVLTERQLSDHSQIQAELVRLKDAKRRIYQDPNAETQVNAVQQLGPCINCKGNHWSIRCILSNCPQCGERGHLQEFCNRIHSYPQRKEPGDYIYISHTGKTHYAAVQTFN